MKWYGVVLRNFLCSIQLNYFNFFKGTSIMNYILNKYIKDKYVYSDCTFKGKCGTN